MQLHGTPTQQTYSGPWTRFLWRATAIAIATVLGVTAALTLARPATAAASKVCSNDTLRGDYGLLVSGVRGIGPDTTESFVGTGVRRYDGNGQFTGVDNAHGQVTGAQRNVPVSGTYEVNADCSGTSRIFFPGAPFPVETAFVVVGDGDEVKDLVMAPRTNLVTAVLRRVGP